MQNLINIRDDNGTLVVDSREVAKNFEKRHDHVLNSIENIITENPGLIEVYFFRGHYKSGTGKSYKRYLMTRDGFTLLAMGFTGKKALEWKLKYIEAFNAMEETIKNNVLPSDLSPQLQLLINMELKQKQLETAIADTKEEIKGIREVVALNPTQWRKDTADLINKLARKMGGYEHIKALREESYKLLDQRFGVDLQTRLTNKRRRMADEGVCKSKRNKLNHLDVIADDKKLIEGYISIIKEMAIKYGGEPQ